MIWPKGKRCKVFSKADHGVKIVQNYDVKFTIGLQGKNILVKFEIRHFRRPQWASENLRHNRKLCLLACPNKENFCKFSCEQQTKAQQTLNLTTYWGRLALSARSSSSTSSSFFFSSSPDSSPDSSVSEVEDSSCSKSFTWSSWKMEQTRQNLKSLDREYSETFLLINIWLQSRHAMTPQLLILGQGWCTVTRGSSHHNLRCDTSSLSHWVIFSVSIITAPLSDTGCLVPVAVILTNTPSAPGSWKSH